MGRTLSMAWGSEDRRRQEQGAMHVKRLAVLTAQQLAGDQAATAILARFRVLWGEGMNQWEALRLAEREMG